MDNQPLVSVIMNCYNSDTYLKEAIDSVISQTYENWELIFWDNQSTDDSANIVKSYDIDERIRYFYANEHTDLGRARNLAIEKVESEWIAFLDCDDLWASDKLSIFVDTLKIHNNTENIGLVYTKSIVINSNDDELYKIDRCTSGNIHDQLLVDGNFIVQSSMIVNKKIFNKVNGIDERLKFCTDYDLLLKITKEYIAIGIDEYLTSYRIHENNLTSRKLYDNSLEVVNFLKEYNNKNDLSYYVKVNIFINNSYRLGALFIKLLISKEYKSMFKLFIKYFFNILIAPFSIFYVKLGRKK